jgi:hypothetical protein
MKGPFFAEQLEGENPLTAATAERLLRTSMVIGETKPWEFMWESQLVLLRDDQGQVHSISVMGNSGKFEAVTVYCGPGGFAFFEKMAEERDLDHFLGNQHSVRLEFTARRYLEKPDRALLTALAPEILKGRKKVPIFRTIRPGYLAWFVTEEEGHLLALALESLLMVWRQARDVRWDEDTYPMVDWSSGKPRISQAAPPRAAQVLPMPDLDLDWIAEVKKQYPEREGSLIVDHFYAPAPVGETNQRKAALRAAVVMDGSTGYAHPPQSEPPETELGVMLASACLRSVEIRGALPELVVVRSKEFERLLRPLAAKLDFKIRVIPVIPPLEEFKQEIFDRLKAR